MGATGGVLSQPGGVLVGWPTPGGVAVGAKPGGVAVGPRPGGVAVGDPDGGNVGTVGNTGGRGGRGAWLVGSPGSGTMGWTVGMMINTGKVAVGRTSGGRRVGCRGRNVP